jgi:hypothetical protein
MIDLDKQYVTTGGYRVRLKDKQDQEYGIIGDIKIDGRWVPTTWTDKGYNLNGLEDEYCLVEVDEDLINLIQYKDYLLHDRSTINNKLRETEQMIRSIGSDKFNINKD